MVAREIQIRQSANYLDYLGLNRNPFPVAPDINSFFVSPAIDEIVSEVLHGICSRKGFIVLTGEIGLGKTTIGRLVLRKLAENSVETALIFNTFAQETDLLDEILRDFGISSTEKRVSTQISVLHEFLLNKNAEGKNCAIVIDDAQNLTYESLELIRLISNLETECEKLVQVLLIGQPELIDMLNRHELRQLKSRIVIEMIAKPLSYTEIKQYIKFKLKAAGGASLHITEKAYKHIYKMTAGNIRAVNKLMDRCLYAAVAANTRYISSYILDEAASDAGFKHSIQLPKIAYDWRLWGLSILSMFAVLFYINGGQLDESAGVKMTVPAVEIVYGKAEPTVVRNSVDRARELYLKEGKSADDGVSQFLDYYKLSNYEPELRNAMADEDISELTDSIYSSTGLQLVAIQNLTNDIKSKYGILKNNFGKAENYFLFWKPAIVLHNIDTELMYKNVLKLQIRLMDMGLYSGSLTGVMDDKTIMAIKHFQNVQNLRVTGYPDKVTLFWIANTSPSF